MGAGPVQAAAKTETDKIIKARERRQKYASPSIPTKEYEPIVEEKTQILTKDVNIAWKILFDRQAPLLTWPEAVQERFRKWGRKWPTTTDPRKVTLAIVDYIDAYPATSTWSTRPSIRSTMRQARESSSRLPKDQLLQPAVFDPRTSARPGKGMGRTGTALDSADAAGGRRPGQQEREKLGFQRDHPPIVELEVGNPAAQDQRSLAKNETLEESKADPRSRRDRSSRRCGRRGRRQRRRPADGSGMMAAPGRSMMGGGRRRRRQLKTTPEVFYVKSGNEQNTRSCRFV